MPKIYFKQIIAGLMSINDVPPTWRAATQALLDEAKASAEN